MFMDALLDFIPQETGLSLIGVTTPQRSSIIDFLGKGVGMAPTPGSVIGNTTPWGQPDGMGVGSNRPELVVATGAAAFVGSGITLQVDMQVAADQGAAGSYQPSTWYTLASTGLIAVGNLTANVLFAKFPWLPPFPESLRPRYISLLFTPSSTGFTTGSIAYASVTPGRDDLYVRQAQRNYAVA